MGTAVNRSATRRNAFMRTMNLVGSLVAFIVATPGHSWSQTCPYIGSGGAPTITPYPMTEGGCVLQSGKVVKRFAQLELHAVGSADGQCLWRGWDCSNLPCECVTITIYERTVNHIYMWTVADAPPLWPDWPYSLGFVFGKDPATGARVDYHVLDSRDLSRSSGPVMFPPPFVGDYSIFFQTISNSTACDIQPNLSDIQMFDVFIRSTLHMGEPGNGMLDGGTQIMNGNGYYHYYGQDPVGTQDAVAGEEGMLDVIRRAGQSWASSHLGQLFGVGDISLPGGGPYDPHTSHENGRDADLRYVRKDGAWGETQGRLDIVETPDDFEKGATIDLIRTFAETTCISDVFVHPNAGISSTDLPGLSVNVIPDVRHSNHLHIRICDPDGPDSNVCQR